MVNGDSGHKRTKAEQGATTRAALLDAATRLFAEKGYASTGREEIVAAAGVTRGAMYHHFADKADLFRAVYVAVEDEVMTEIATAAMGSDDPIEQLQLGCRAYLDAALGPRVRRICIIDAPAVLDEEVRREIATGSALGMVREVLAAAIDSGQMPDQPVDALAHLLLAAVMAAAQYVATADDPERARLDAGTTIDNLLIGLTHGSD
jgi:AcrR family transcriptional regulator